MIIYKVSPAAKESTDSVIVKNIPRFDRPLICSQDMITGDEILSDSYDIKEIDGAVYEADCKKITLGGESFGEELGFRALQYT